MSDPKWCSHCGAQHTGAGALCEKCLAAGVAPAAASAPEAPKPAPAPSEKKPLNVALVMGGAVALVMVAAVVFLLVGGDKAPASPAAGTQPPPTPVADPFEPAGPGEPSPFRDEQAAPPAPTPASGIAGEYWRDTEPPGRPRKMSLCPDGTYFEYAARLGRWTSTGSDEGKVAIAMENGRAVELDYRILREPRFCSKAGCDAEFAGARYGRDPTLGNCR